MNTGQDKLQCCELIPSHSKEGTEKSVLQRLKWPMQAVTPGYTELKCLLLSIHKVCGSAPQREKLSSPPLSMLFFIKLCTWAGCVFQRCNLALRTHVHHLLFTYLCSAALWKKPAEKKIKADNKRISQGMMISGIVRQSLWCCLKVLYSPTVMC